MKSIDEKYARLQRAKQKDFRKIYHKRAMVGETEKTDLLAPGICTVVTPRDGTRPEKFPKDQTVIDEELFLTDTGMGVLKFGAGGMAVPANPGGNGAAALQTQRPRRRTTRPSPGDKSAGGEQGGGPPHSGEPGVVAGGGSASSSSAPPNTSSLKFASSVSAPVEESATRRSTREAAELRTMYKERGAKGRRAVLSYKERQGGCCWSLECLECLFLGARFR